MQPVRIVIPGPEPRILIRMALAGGARTAAVPITLFVLAEAPYRPANYPFALFDDDELEWDRKASSSRFGSSSEPTYAPRSNYDAVADETMDREGRTWLVESSMRAQLAGDNIRTPTAGLYEAYEALCAGARPRETEERSPAGSSSSTKPPCVTVTDAGAAREGGLDGGDDAGDEAGVVDAGDDAGDDAGSDAGSDAETSASDAGGTPQTVTPPRCKTGDDDDYNLATREVIGASRVIVTRLRARIRPEALVRDLDLVPASGPDAQEISNLHQVARYDDEDDRPNKRSCATTKANGRGDRAPAASWALGAAAALVLSAWLRRKRR
jgi:hypothetical protein